MVGFEHLSRDVFMTLVIILLFLILFAVNQELGILALCLYLIYIAPCLLIIVALVAWYRYRRSKKQAVKQESNLN
jgi:Ca2+/Na+ antiporter